MSKIADLMENQFSLIEPLKDYIDLCDDELDMDDVYSMLDEIIRYYGLTYDNSVDELNNVYKKKPFLI